MKLFGIVPPVLTPFNADETPDEGAFRALISFLIERGVHGLFPLGSAGDGVLLTVAERKRLARAAVEEARGRVPVMINTSAITTAKCIDLTRHAQEAGADAVSILPPFYYRYDDDAIFAHIKAAAEAAPDVAVYVYNNPSTTGNPISTALMKRLAAACPNMAGAKDSSDSVAQSADYVRALGDRYAVLTGSSVIPVASFVVGCSGVILALANAFPEMAVSMWDAYGAGDVAAALGYQDTLIAARAAMLKNGGVMPGLKAALQARGLPVGGARRPMRVCTAIEQANVEAACRRLGLLTPIA